MSPDDPVLCLLREHPQARRWVVAFSGGMDSHVLLDLAVRSLHGRVDAPLLEVLHVDHGVHPDSGIWAAHCERVDGVAWALRNRRARK